MDSSTRRVPWVYLGPGILYVVMLLLTAISLRQDFAFGLYRHLAEGTRAVFGLVGLIAALRAARATGLLPRLRQAWRTMAVCFGVLLTSPVLVVVVRAAGFKAADDLTHIVFVVLLLIALYRFPLAATNLRERWKAALDAGIVLVAGTVLLWYLSVGPYLVAHGLTLTVVITSLVYPLFDLALLFIVARALLRGADHSALRPLRLLGGGTLVLFAGDSVHGYLHGHGQLQMHSPWQLVCWITADALLGAAAIDQCRVLAAGPRPARDDRGIGRYLPFAAIAMAHGLMLAAALHEHSVFPWGGLALGGSMLSALVVCRQLLVQRESDEQALTDGLTGLANRSRFRTTSYRDLARAARTGSYAAVVVMDMNGFKEINDTLGHKAGDLALVEFAGVLRRCVPEPGLPARMGGDEFAVIMGDLDRPEQAHELAASIAAGMGPVLIDGKRVTLAASIGVAVSAPGELTHDEMVHRADLAMYRAKSLGSETRWQIWQEALEPMARSA